MRKVGYVFNKENDFDRTKEATRIVLGIDSTNTQIPLIRGKITAFVKVLSLVAMTDSKQAKCVEVVPDATTGDYAAPIGTPWQFDSDNLTNDYTTTNVLSMTALAVNEVVEVEQYIDKSTDFQWLAKKQAAASGIFILIITASGANVNTYTADIIDNRTDKTVLTEDVTLKALDHTDGTIPNGNILTCSFDSINSFYEPTNYSIAYGVP